VSDAEMGAIIRELPPAQAVGLLVNLANIRGGPDNSTALIVRVGDLPANVPPPVHDEPEDDRLALGWSWLIGFWVTSLLLVCGLAMQWLGHPIKGSLLVAFSLLGLGGLLVGSMRRRRILLESAPDNSHTQHSRPHRTAVGLTSRSLLDLLIRTDAELQRSAQEDGWEVNWPEHDRALVSAKQSSQEKRYAKALREAARAIGTIMEELPRASHGA
jgi:protein phosphatase